MPATFENIPVQNKPLSKKDSADGIKVTTVPTVFYAATMNDTTGTIYLKIVNASAKKQTIKINLNGIDKVEQEATMIVIKSNQPDDTNTITDRENIKPVTSIIKDIKTSFTKVFEPYSVNILELKTGK